MGESARHIQIRSLTGESTTVSISPDKTIKDLKLLLRLSFPPASNSPNFHLFLKGVKLGLKTQISIHSIESGEFMVLVPYTKKDQQQTQEYNKDEACLEGRNECSTSEAADLVWCDMIQDLSYMRNISKDRNEPNAGSKSDDSTDEIEVTRPSPINQPRQTKRKRGFNCHGKEETECLIKSLLQSSGNTQLDHQNCERFMQVLEPVNCLSNLHSGNCMLKEVSLQDGDMNTCAIKNDFCLCPSWLKTIMKAFYFLNIYSAYLQMRQERITISCLKEALDKLCKFGLEVGFADIEHLSVLCPKVVSFVDDNIGVTNLLDALFIINTPVKQRHQAEYSSASKLVPASKILNAMRKRERLFKSNLCDAIKLFLRKSGNAVVKFLSLEHLLMFVEEGDTTANRNETKPQRRNRSEASSSRSFEGQCHDTNPLPPIGMVEHLRSGLGSKGQVVHVEEISARVASHVDIPNELSDNMKSVLRSIGITRLYSHQAESVQASLSGKNVVVATMTSSGKSLCYNLPVLELLSQDLLACALYLFPTKALAQDQLRALLAMSKGLDVGLNIGIYDGDTSENDRIWLRDNARLVFY